MLLKQQSVKRKIESIFFGDKNEDEMKVYFTLTVYDAKADHWRRAHD